MHPHSLLHIYTIGNIIHSGGCVNIYCKKAVLSPVLCTFTLKAQLSSLKNKKAADDYKALTEYMTANDLSASDVLEFIKA